MYFLDFGQIKNLIKKNYLSIFFIIVLTSLCFLMGYFQIFNKPISVFVKMSAPGEEIVKAYWENPQTHPNSYKPLIVKPIESQQWDLKIEALGQKNSDSDGFEVGILDIRTSQGQINWSQGVFGGGEWEFREDPNSPEGQVAIAHSNKPEFGEHPGQVQYFSSLIEGGDIEVKFFAHTGSGEVKVTANKHVKTLDLFRIQGDYETVKFPAMAKGDAVSRDYQFSIPDRLRGKLYLLAEKGSNVFVDEIRIDGKKLQSNSRNIYFYPFRIISRFHLSIFSTLIIAIFSTVFFEKIKLLLITFLQSCYVFLLSQRQYYREYIFYFSLTIVIPIAFLFSPQPAEEIKFCGQYITVLDNIAGFPLNCDSGGFTDLLIHPEQILIEGQVRQTRPLYIVFGWLFSLIPSGIVKILDITYFLPDTHIYLEHYLGYLFLNIFIVFVSLVLYHKILMYFNVHPYLIYTSSVFLVGNEVVKGFFWTPHQQMFIIATPITAIFLLCFGLAKQISNKFIFVIALILGFLPLAYGSFFLLFPSLFIIYLRNTKKRLFVDIKKFLFGLFILPIIFMLPVLLWVGFVKLTTESFYSHETAVYRQFIWVLDELQVGLSNFFDVAILRLQSYLNLTQEIKNALLINLIAMAWIIFCYGKVYLFRLLSKLKYLYLIYFIFITFFYFLGSYFERLYFNLFIINILINTISINEILILDKRYKLLKVIFVILIFSLSAIYFGQILLQFGPYD